jgi:hypothetical protein
MSDTRPQYPFACNQCKGVLIARTLLLVMSSRVQATDGLNDALLRASAERASQAILMTPLITHDFENEDQRLASKVVIGEFSLLKRGRVAACAGNARAMRRPAVSRLSIIAKGLCTCTCTVCHDMLFDLYHSNDKQDQPSCA